MCAASAGRSTLLRRDKQRKRMHAHILQRLMQGHRSARCAAVWHGARGVQLKGMAAAKLSCHPSRGVWVCFWCKMRSELWPAVCTPAPLCKIAARSLQDAACCGVSRGSRWACAPLLGLRGRWDVHLVQLWPAPRARWAARSHSPAPRRGALPTAKLQEDLGVETRSKRVVVRSTKWI